MQKYVAAERFYLSKQMPEFSFSTSFEKNVTEFMTGHRKLIKEQQAKGLRMEEDKRKKSSGSSSNVRRKSLPRAAKNKLTQIQVFLDEREHQESQQQVL